MRVEVLVAAMHQKDHSLLEKMNIQTDAIVGNQCDKNEIEQFEYKGNDIRYLSFCERGVGLNRNNALMRATADFCVFADDDMRFFDGYNELVLKAFSDNPKADIVVFNIKEKTPTRYVNKRNKKIHFYNFLRYGAARIAIRTDSIHLHGIFFNQCFGGGTPHSAGEDNLFLAACLKAGLKIYASPYCLAELLENRESTWFKGYDDKYLEDKGCLFRVMFPKVWRFMCFQDAFRLRKHYKQNWLKAYFKMVGGGKRC